MSRIWGVLVLSLLIACTPAAAPAAPTQPTAAPAGPKRSENQVFRMGQGSLPASASPESSSTYIYLFWNQFDPLVQFDKDFNIRPSVAERWESLPNGAGWRFFLRKDMTWANGDKLTAADLDFTVKLVQQNRLPQLSFISFVTESRIVDDYTVDYLTRQPDISLFNGGVSFFVLPKKYYETVGKDAFALKPMGSGPYDLAEFKPNDVMVYKLRPNNNHPFRKPNLSEIRFQSVPDSAAVLNGLRLGEIDLNAASLSPDQLTRAKAEGISVFTAPGGGLSWTVVIDKAASERSTPALLDKRVRLALNYAIDRATIARTIYSGFAQPIGQENIPGMPMYDPANTGFTFDQAQAKRLLAEAGYPNGFTVSNPVDFPTSNANVSNLMLAVADYWKQIGVNVEVRGSPIVVWGDIFRQTNGKIRNEFSVTAAGDGNGLFLLGRTNYNCTNPPELVIWCVPAFDQSMNAAYAEADATKRTALLRAANKALTDEAVHVYTIFEPLYWAAGPKIAGLDIKTNYYWSLDSAYRIE